MDVSSGNIVIMGGDDEDNNGVKDALEFNTENYQVRNHPKGDMTYARWYATSIGLDDGRIFVAGGRSEITRIGSSTPEIWSPDSGFRVSAYKCICSLSRHLCFALESMLSSLVFPGVTWGRHAVHCAEWLVVSSCLCQQQGPNHSYECGHSQRGVSRGRFGRARKCDTTQR